MRPALPILLALAAACGGTTGPQLGRGAPTLDEPFQLRVGQRAELPGALTLRFVEVGADSRCPSKAFILCVWEGDAAVLVEIAPAEGDARTDTLHTRLDPKAVEVGSLTLELVRLDPYPEDVEPIPSAEYVATFVVR